MADIRLNVVGDSGGATAALRDVQSELRATSEAGAQAWSKAEAAERTHAANLLKVQAAFAAVGAAAVKFGVDAARAFMEAERVSKQLARAAGGLADAFEKQASALSAQLAVDDDLIKQQQTLLLQWGALPQQIEGAVRATHDYAAATGGDALSATQLLIRSVETGVNGFEKYGIAVDLTGDKTKDLELLTAALAAKMGGAGAEDASTLAGSVRRAEIAFEDLKESFGGFVGALESKTGLIDKVANALRGIAGAVAAASSPADLVAALSPQGLAAAAIMGQSRPLAPNMPNVQRPAPIHLVDPQGRTAAQIAASRRRGGGGGGGAAGSGAITASLKLGEEGGQGGVGWYEGAVYERARREADAIAKAQAELADRLDKQSEALWEQVAKNEEEHAAQVEKSVAATIEAARKAEDKAREVGDAIGAAFVNGLATQLDKLASGGQFDAALFVGDMLGTMLQVAGTVIGSAYGMPALGSALGGLASTGVRAGFGAMSRAGNRMHSGGWVGLPRYHDGTWIGGDEEAAILQSGERVLSRREVSAMGGPSGVDSAARGGGRVNVYINALDSKSAADSFETQTGRGLARAIRYGRGDVARLFALSPAGAR